MVTDRKRKKRISPKQGGIHMRNYAYTRVQGIAPGTIPNPIVEAASIIKQAEEIAAAEWTAEEQIDAGDPIAEVVSLAFDFLQLMIFFTVFIIFILLLGMAFLGQKTVGKVWLVGDQIGKVFNPIIDWLFRILYAAVTRFGELVVDIDKLIGATFKNLSAWGGLATESTVTKQIRTATHPLTKGLGDVTDTAHTLWVYVFGGTNTKGHKIHSLITQVNELQTRLDHLHIPKPTKPVNLTSIDRDLTTLKHILDVRLDTHRKPYSHYLHSIVTEVGTITQTLHKVQRQVQQQEHEITTLREQIKHIPPPLKQHNQLTQEQINHFTHAYQVSLSVAPLLKLLPLSVENLRNLNKLKNDPCQCKDISSDTDMLLWAAIGENIAANGI